MRYMVISAVALAGMAVAAEPADPAASATQEPPAEARPCDGSVPVFNPEGCPQKPIDVDECEQAIEQVRDANGQPSLRRENADDAQEAELVAAVDHRIDGCSVLVMHNDTADVRPLPEPGERAEMIPAD